MFKPFRYLHSVYDLDFSALRCIGIRGIVVDLDNTLLEWHRDTGTERLRQWFDTARENGMKAILVSNSKKPRVSKIAEPFGIPYIAFAKKPLPFAYRKALRLMDLPPEAVVVIGDQLLTDILGGNLYGLKTILVAPLSQKEGLVTRINRRLERLILRLFVKRLPDADLECSTALEGGKDRAR
ncbi:MAG: YqeG family HAD IIIA-type phosphatase [Candidatus Carbobacillus altaicus]|uniref:Hydrolase, HAD subfamily IIIA n=1 Tax=Candidatus Carbonibacillus altaicus TaxID=2163959 RepID=A0A2R6Y1A7_9BACL|nr:YqeG family HAD IIIA-type phosphatase [Candidatus Carbobacillus altaicus]PTQ56469.1 MAG: Hydrolase, HAD subfamily IIIA [Candidatus Carbobacillus altaicus]